MLIDDDPRAVSVPGAQPPAAEPELIMNLEPDQLVLETLHPVPRARLSRGAVLGLWALRIFSIVLSAMVIYAFIASLH